jgi:hypothetical protein
VPFIIKFSLVVFLQHKQCLAPYLSVATSTSSNFLARLVHRIMKSIAKLQGTLLFSALDTIKKAVSVDTPLLQLFLNIIGNSSSITLPTLCALVVIYSSQLSVELHPAATKRPLVLSSGSVLTAGTILKLIREDRLSFAIVVRCFTYSIFIHSRYTELFVSLYYVNSIWFS